MLDRRSPAAPMAIFLPPQSLSRRRSSLLSLATSASSSSPRTPSRSCASPSYSSALFFASSTCNRASTDSWNSSIQEIEDLEREWTPDQSLFLIRTLDALPAHLITPYNGIPPSNLLDKIARGVSQAKGHDWPHSLRATRVKLLELARNRANEEKVAAANAALAAATGGNNTSGNPNSSTTRKHRRVSGPNASTIAEEPVTEHLSATLKQKRANASSEVRRPLYRQSSMDFVTVPPSEFQNNEKLARLSRRLQTTDRIIDSPSKYGMRSGYSRNPSPSRLLNPSTASSSTLNSTYSSSLSSGDRPGKLSRRSASTLATSNVSSEPPSPCTPPASPTQSEVNIVLTSCKHTIPAETRQQMQQAKYNAAAGRIKATMGPAIMSPSRTRSRRSDSCSAPKRPYKRAPSFGALAQEARKSGMDIDGQSCASSDEEEKKRNEKTKKARTKSHEDATPSSGQPPCGTPTGKRTNEPKVSSLYQKASRLDSTTSRANRRKPMAFGGELPGLSRIATSTSSRNALHIAIPSSPLKESIEIPTQPTSPVSPTIHRGHQQRYRPLQPSSQARSPQQSPSPIRSPALSPSSPPQSPSLPAHLKTLRRVRRLDLASTGRRISFNSLAKCTEDDEREAGIHAATRSAAANRRANPPRLPMNANDNGLGMLGSAFQLG